MSRIRDFLDTDIRDMLGLRSAPASLPVPRTEVRVVQKDVPTKAPSDKSAEEGVKVPRNMLRPESHLVRDAQLRRYYSSVENNERALKNTLSVVRRASRAEARSNDYFINVVRQIRNNVVGTGVQFRSRAVDDGGVFDPALARRVEEAWADWGRPGNCEVTGTLSWNEIENLAMTGIVEDGESLFLSHARGEFGFQVQHLDPTRLDDLKEDSKRRIYLGVQKDEFGAPTFYHLRKGDLALLFGLSRYQTEAYPAERVAHIFAREWPEQTRGVPWLSQGLSRWPKIADFESAELDAAIVAGRHMGMVERTAEAASRSTVNSDDPAAASPSNENEDGFVVVPGASSAGGGAVAVRLEEGETLKPFPGGHPSPEYSQFRKAQLQGAAAGAGVSYADVTQDYGGYSFSSVRAARIAEQDVWRSHQKLLVTHLHEWVFRRWVLQYALKAGIRPDMIAPHEFVPRTWTHVQPREQSRADQIDLETGMASLPQKIRERGFDPRSVAEDNRQYFDYLEELGLPLPSYAAAGPGVEEAMEDAVEEAVRNNPEALRALK